MHGMFRLIDPEALKSHHDAQMAMDYLTSQGHDVFLIERRDNRHVFVVTREHGLSNFLDTPFCQMISYTSARGVEVVDRHWHEHGHA